MENKKEMAVIKANKLIGSPQKTEAESLKKGRKRLKVFDAESTRNAGKELSRTHSALDEKLMNACVHKMQIENSSVRYEELKTQAINVVEAFGIDKIKNKFVYDCACEEEVRKILRAKIKKIYVFDSSEILSLCGIDGDNIKYALKKLKEFQSKNASLITEYVPNENFTDVEEQISSINPIPRVTFRKNRIEVELQSYAIPYLFALAHGFTKVNMLQVQNLKSTYSMRLYDICNMLYKIQNTKTYEFEELQALFGTNYKTLTEFKKNVLNRAMLEVSEKTDISVEMHKNGQKIKFRIIRKSNLISTADFVLEEITLEKLAHFLTCEQFFRNLGRVTAIKDFFKYKKGVLRKLEQSSTDEISTEMGIAERNYSALAKIKEFLSKTSTNYVLDTQYLVVRTDEQAVNDYGYVRVGDNPIECLEYLTKRKFDEKQPLPSPTPQKIDLEAAVDDEYEYDAEDPRDIFVSIVAIAPFQYTNSAADKIKIDITNIEIMAEEMINRCTNSTDQYRFFYFPKSEQKVLFARLIEKLKK